MSAIPKKANSKKTLEQKIIIIFKKINSLSQKTFQNTEKAILPLIL